MHTILVHPKCKEEGGGGDHGRNREMLGFSSREREGADA